MKRSPSSLAPLLRSDVQGRLLAAVMADPEVEHSIAQLTELSGTSQTTVLREIDRAEAAGIVRSRRIGRARLVRAEPGHPLYEPLARIIVTTYGPPAVIADELAGIDGIERAMLFGSWAARYAGTPGPWPNDIDVLVVGDADLGALYDAADRAEARLGLPVQITFRTPTQWADAGDPFVAEVKSRPLVELVPNDAEAHGDLATGT